MNEEYTFLKLKEAMLGPCFHIQMRAQMPVAVGHRKRYSQRGERAASALASGYYERRSLTAALTLLIISIVLVVVRAIRTIRAAAVPPIIPASRPSCSFPGSPRYAVYISIRTGVRGCGRDINVPRSEC